VCGHAPRSLDSLGEGERKRAPLVGSLLLRERGVDGEREKVHEVSKCVCAFVYCASETLPSHTPLTQWNSEVVMLAEPPAKSEAEILGNFGKCILGNSMSMF